MFPRPLAHSLAVLSTGLAIACSSHKDEGARQRLLSAGRASSHAPFDFRYPLKALRESGDAAAARAGSFSWEARVNWTVFGKSGKPVLATERHRLRQTSSGNFELTMNLDPGGGLGSTTGKRIIFANGITYAGGLWAPMRKRTADRGHGARRFRDDSFQAAADLVDLYGPALAIEDAGETVFLARPARRFVISLSDERPTPAKPPTGLPARGYDPDTRRRVDFLQGRIPTSLQGELVLDAVTALPLFVAMKGAFSEKADPQLHAEVALTAEVKSLGSGVPPVLPPADALPDNRKPNGVADALEAAGLRKPHQQEGEKGEEGEQEQ
ncbi:MAG TPA: hypothetical protein VMK12_02885 [Anaeromyxobacteraceae bacterium]|nr:hypothetical protein [Anaeromyxobacteraceae bacterium]